MLRRRPSELIQAIAICVSLFLFMFLFSNKVEPELIEVDKPFYLPPTEKPHKVRLGNYYSPLNGRQWGSNQRRRNLLLFCYMRGGSTLLYGLFNHDKRAQTWYEPLGPLYGQMYGFPLHRLHMTITHDGNKLRSMTKREEEAVHGLLEGMASCRMKKMPTAVLSSNFLEGDYSARAFLACYREGGGPWEHDCLAKGCIYEYCATNNSYSVPKAMANDCHRYLDLARSTPLQNWTSVGLNDDLNASRWKCMRPYAECMIKAQTTIKRCLPKLTPNCHKKDIVVAKLLRVKMFNLKRILENTSAFYSVVFFVRDPRAISHSRSFAKVDQAKWITRSKALCAEMRSDLTAALELETAIPKSVVLLRYEDLVQEPVAYTEKLYEHIGMHLTPEVKKWLLNIMNSKGDGRPFTLITEDIESRMNRWRAEYSEAAVNDVTNDPTCQALLKELGYVV